MAGNAHSWRPVHGGSLDVACPAAAENRSTLELIDIPTTETGWHVRKGYTPEDFSRLCRESGLDLQAVSYCSGFLSQKATYVFRAAGRIHPAVGWALSLPLRVLPPLVDGPITKALDWPAYSICLEARRPLAS